MVMDKSRLRRRMRATRAAVGDRAGKSDAIARRLLDGLLNDGAPHLHAGLRDAMDGAWFVYVSHGDEVGTHGLIRELLARGRTVAVPRLTEQGAMVAQRIALFERLQPGRYGILEPTDDDSVVEPDLCVLPCVAVTQAGDRLGMGGGYYDRYLTARPDVQAIALAFDEQVIDAAPVEPHDRRVRWIVTPTRMIRCQ